MCGDGLKQIIYIYTVVCMYVYIYGSFTICCRILRVMTAYLCSRGTWGRSPRTRDMFGAAASRSRRDWDLCQPPSAPRLPHPPPPQISMRRFGAPSAPRLPPPRCQCVGLAPPRLAVTVRRAFVRALPARARCMPSSLIWGQAVVSELSHRSKPSTGPLPCVSLTVCTRF